MIGFFEPVLDSSVCGDSIECNNNKRIALVFDLKVLSPTTSAIFVALLLALWFNNSSLHTYSGNNVQSP